MHYKIECLDYLAFEFCLVGSSYAMLGVASASPSFCLFPANKRKMIVDTITPGLGITGKLPK